MTFLLALVALILFVTADVVIRKIMGSVRERRLQREREEALAVNLKLDFSDEAKTLKRVTVTEPKATILAVDDEAVVLDSFRKILVMDGYSIDTVENGPEALGLVRKRDYDFVFTDLKMPEMDGVEVCKAVKHLRPDIDVIIITGYASVESAVETMKFGAMDYIQKPFTEDELIGMVRKFLIRRENRLQKQQKPQVRITNFTDSGAITGNVEFGIPGGVFVSRGHCWAGLDPSGNVYVGIDDFARKTIGEIDAVEMPESGVSVEKGQKLFSIVRGNRKVPFLSPVGGKVINCNEALAKNARRFQDTSYGDNWICLIGGGDLESDLKDLRIGVSAVEFFGEEIDKLKSFVDEDSKASDSEAGAAMEGELYLGVLGKLENEPFAKATGQFFGGA
ncbi:MAG: response regulator [Candidatus Latescibacterota bacterium]|jgi:CheY-like chemotaxis protein